MGGSFFKTLFGWPIMGDLWWLYICSNFNFYLSRFEGEVGEACNCQAIYGDFIFVWNSTYICLDLESYIWGEGGEAYNCQAIYGDFIFVWNSTYICLDL